SHTYTERHTRTHARVQVYLHLCECKSAYKHARNRIEQQNIDNAVTGTYPWYAHAGHLRHKCCELLVLGFCCNRGVCQETMYDDSPNFQIQIKELGSREKWSELQERRRAEEQRAEAQRLQRLSNAQAAEGDTGSGWSAAPASADLSAPDQGVAGVMVAAVGSLQESGFAARRAASRLKEMQTTPYLQAAQRRRESMSAA
ncbi:unnamed protein product, partial [Effrenium voratum]